MLKKVRDIDIQILEQSKLLPSVELNSKVYKYKDFLGKGTYGIVYMYENEESKHKVAVKVQIESIYKSIGDQIQREIENYEKL